jgi:hypothetical protein
MKAFQAMLGKLVQLRLAAEARCPKLHTLNAERQTLNAAPHGAFGSFWSDIVNGFTGQSCSRVFMTNAARSVARSPQPYTRITRNPTPYTTHPKCQTLHCAFVHPRNHKLRRGVTSSHNRIEMDRASFARYREFSGSILDPPEYCLCSHIPLYGPLYLTPGRGRASGLIPSHVAPIAVPTPLPKFETQAGGGGLAQPCQDCRGRFRPQNSQSSKFFQSTLVPGFH